MMTDMAQSVITELSNANAWLIPIHVLAPHAAMTALHMVAPAAATVRTAQHYRSRLRRGASATN